MGMDALQAAALDSLTKNVLPKLSQSLEALTILPAESRTPPTDLAFLVSEAEELLSLLTKWLHGDETASELLTIDPANSNAPAPDGDMSDAEARALMAEMDAASGEAGAHPTNLSEDMSDDEARALLAEMDAPTAAVNATKTGSSEDMSDDEARALLADMDAPPAPAMTAAPAKQPSPPTAKSAAPTENHGDEEENLEEIPEFSQNDFSSDPDMLNDFNANADELMEALDSQILDLEQNPNNRETIEGIFRAAHTLKGAAGMFGFLAIERVMHRMENLFDQVRKGNLVPDSSIIDVVFQGIDILRKLLEAVKQGKSSGTKTVPITQALTLAASGRYVKGSLESGSAAADPKPKPVAHEPTNPAAAHEAEGEEARGQGKNNRKKEPSTIRVDLERLDALVNLVGELVIDRTRFASIEENIRTAYPQLKVTGHMSETVQLFGRHMNEIHDIIMKIRMVPIGNAFNKFTRIVRDLARQLNKQIDLVIEGEETELDKTLVEQIGDPLIHLIRNSCDHGIETPETRQAAKKSAAGRISLSARQEGNYIVITIEDDGKGMNAEAIRKKGIERGLISEDATLTKADIFNLIFEPGFSTAEKVTTVSGRGVGMDVVRKQIAKLKGMIDIDSEQGRGTTITIQLPLTLAIVQSLLIQSHGECFAIPSSAVIESVRIKREDIQRVGEAEVIKRHGKVLPLMHLDDTLCLSTKGDISWYADYSGREHSLESTNRKRKDRLFVVIVGSGERRFGIVVDHLLNQQEMVIKSMGPVMRGIPCVAGGAVLGNGEVVLVLDIQELEDQFRSRGRHHMAA